MSLGPAIIFPICQNFGWLDLYGSYADNHGCYEVDFLSPVQRTVFHSTLLQPPTPVFLLFLFWSDPGALSMVVLTIDVPFWAEHSVSYSQHFMQLGASPLTLIYCKCVYFLCVKHKNENKTLFTTM